MEPPLRERLRMAGGDTRTDPGAMARSLLCPFGVGGAMALTALATAGAGDLPRVALTATLCWIVAVLLLLGYDRLPAWLFPAIVAAGTGAIAWSVAETGGAQSPVALLFVWVVVYSLYFLSKPVAVAELALMAGLFAAAAVAGDGTAPTDPAWPVTAAALLGAGGLVGLQRAHANRLIRRLSNAARTDSLTGLMNRRGFEELFETELERARRADRPLALIVGDLDRFKQLNDRFGHGAGDRALERLALILGVAKRRIDTAARIGGEEFAVLVPDTDRHAAYILAERMRREVRQTFMDEPHGLTISLGVAGFPEHGSSAEELIARADEALYAAKALGRDRTAVYSAQVAHGAIDAAARERLGDPAAPPAEGRSDATVLALADAIDARDPGTAAHSQTVGRYAAAIARELGLPEHVVERVRFGGIVHDVGKIGIPDTILRKPGWLTAEDWHEMRRHPEVGAQILSGVDLDDIGDWVRAHHERPDGTGYPDGLMGPDIPLEARILAVADAYEAMTSDRVYRRARSREDARAELVRCAGTQFDRRVVEAFVRVLEGRGAARELKVAG